MFLNLFHTFSNMNNLSWIYFLAGHPVVPLSRPDVILSQTPKHEIRKIHHFGMIQTHRTGHLNFLSWHSFSNF